ncbi:hypothetical protein HKX48_002896 [Thoreauomyces humboldtii]|nr:hypothetical protein HKX48_002896 [Thoreauomyces humboldtii]
MTTSTTTPTVPASFPTTLPTTITVTTPRLTLRTTVPADSARLCEVYSDPVTMLHLACMYQPWTVPEMDAKCEEKREKQSRHLCIPLTIVHTATDRVLGTCGFRDIDLKARTAEWGCILDAEAGGMGYGTEIMLGLVGYVVEELGVEEVVVVTGAKNVAMRGMVERLGVPQVWPEYLGKPGQSGFGLEDPVCYMIKSGEFWTTLKAKLEAKMERILGNGKVQAKE